MAQLFLVPSFNTLEPTTHPDTPLTDEVAAFIQGGVSIAVASCDAGLHASLARAYACRVSPDRSRITLVLRSSQAAAVLADIRATGRISAAFTQPSTHRTYQLKGTDAVIEPLRPFDHACVDARNEAFWMDVQPFGIYSRELVFAVMGSDPADRTAVSFTPRQVFSQTPGAGAGTRLP